MAQPALRSSQDDLRALVQEDEQLPPPYCTIFDTAPEWPQYDNQPPRVAPADVNPRRHYDSPPPAYHSGNIEPATLHFQYISIGSRAGSPASPAAVVLGARSNQNRGAGSSSRANFVSAFDRDLFARKVYAALACQMLITAGFVAVFLYNLFIKHWVQKTAVNLSFICMTAVVSLMLCCAPVVFTDSVRSNSPAKFIWLVIFTLAKSFLLGVISCAYDTQWIFIAVSLTMVACLILYTFGSRINCGICACLVVLPFVSYSVFWLSLLQQHPAQLQPLIRGSVAPFAVLFFLSRVMRQTTNDSSLFVKPNDFVFTVLNIYWNVAGYFLIVLCYSIFIILV